MAEKPPKAPFSVVTALPLKVPDPPRPLGPAGLALWRAIQEQYNVSDAGGVQVLLAKSGIARQYIRTMTAS
jgi:hypothetical protein